LFVFGIEILGNAIRSSNELKGIEIDARNALKLSEYADDTAAFLRDTQSLNNLFSLLTQFEDSQIDKVTLAKFHFVK